MILHLGSLRAKRSGTDQPTQHHSDATVKESYYRLIIHWGARLRNTANSAGHPRSSVERSTLDHILDLHATPKDGNPMLSELRLWHFRAFDNFTMNLRKTNLLVGPNSAGKSTLLTAFRFARACLKLASRSSPIFARQHKELSVQAYPLPLREFAVLEESVHHEFRDQEAGLRLRWAGGSALTAVWPAADADGYSEPFFYLRTKAASQPRNPQQVRGAFTDFGVVPALTPLEHQELVLSEEHLKKNLDTRLASRHFRNQLHMLATAGLWDAFTTFTAPWLGGLELTAPRVSHGLGEKPSLDVFYTEPGGGVPKELVWAGDGVQIWIQLLLHLFRNRQYDSVLLDEPEVFLHADVQRRLVRLLGFLDSQYILATHSAEVVAEVAPAAIVWVDKTRRRAVRSPQDETLREMNSALGSSFNLSLAKVLRARGVLFVEGKDVRLLKILAGRLSFMRLIEELTLAVVPIEGFSNYRRLEHFGWIGTEFLDGAVKTLAVLDRDYRTDKQIKAVEMKIAASGVAVHVWRRKELESYLIVPEAISRTTSRPVDDVAEMIDEAIAEQETHVFARIVSERLDSEVSAHRHRTDVMEDARKEFDEAWMDPEYRLRVAPPKAVLASVNRRLQYSGHKSASFEAIARNLAEGEISGEVRAVLERIEDLAR